VNGSSIMTIRVLEGGDDTTVLVTGSSDIVAIEINFRDRETIVVEFDPPLLIPQ
jgi:hypothetical protein